VSGDEDHPVRQFVAPGRPRRPLAGHGGRGGAGGPAAGAAEVIEVIKHAGWALADMAYDQAQWRHGAVLLLFRRRYPSGRPGGGITDPARQALNPRGPVVPVARARSIGHSRSLMRLMP
jgi:hypothetical protein